MKKQMRKIKVIAVILLTTGLASCSNCEYDNNIITSTGEWCIVKVDTVLIAVPDYRNDNKSMKPFILK